MEATILKYIGKWAKVYSTIRTGKTVLFNSRV
jgi:hypothetical protein